MKLIHLADLHLGKRVNEFPMIEDQEYILLKILGIIDEEKPDGILIAGDVYDKSVPSEEAMRLWDDFLVRLAERRIPVFAISGNHDSAVRFADHGKLVDVTGIHLAPGYNGTIPSYTVQDEHGPVHIYLLPFIKPVMVRSYFEGEEIRDYTDACRVVIENAEVNTSERNVLVAHQFVAGAERCESEENVGGLDNVSVDVFDPFDYVALGHLHGPQKVGRDAVRYAGSPLKYSFSEKDHHKSVTVVELGEKGDVTIRTVPLVPKHDLREIRGSYMELTAKSTYEGTDTEDYIHAVLTDEEDVLDAMARLRSIYPNIMKLTYDNRRTRTNAEVSGAVDVENKSPLELFSEFYALQNTQELSDSQREMVNDMIVSIWEA
jgi:exonuclease SbcD